MLTQTFTDWECIVVDDGSVDTTRQIAEEYAGEDNRFKVFYQKNGGVSSARNTGLSHVSGEWVCFLDSDDEFPPKALSCYFNKTGFFDFYLGGYTIYDSQENVSYEISDTQQFDLDRDEAIALMYIPKHYQYLGYIAGKLFKHTIIHQANLTFNQDIYFNEDRLFTTQYMCHCQRICFFTESVYHYYTRSNSAMSSLYKAFNIRFFTDLDAMILMKEAIASSSPANLQNAKEGIAYSYWIIQDLLNHFHANTFKRFFLLHRKLLHNLPIKDYYHLVCTPFVRKIFQKVVHKIINK